MGPKGMKRMADALPGESPKRVSGAEAADPCTDGIFRPGQPREPWSGCQLTKTESIGKLSLTTKSDKRQANGPADRILPQSGLSCKRTGRQGQHRSSQSKGSSLHLPCVQHDVRRNERDTVSIACGRARNWSSSSSPCWPMAVRFKPLSSPFGLDERTVLSWQERSGKHCEQVHQHLVEQPRDLGQVQGDEIRVKIQGAHCLDGDGDAGQDPALAGRCAQYLPRHSVDHGSDAEGSCLCLVPSAVVLHGWLSGVHPSHPLGLSGSHSDRQSRTSAFATVGWHLHGPSGQAVCWQTGGRHSAASGARDRWLRCKPLVQQTQGGGTINTAYIERLNATFRARICCLGAARSCTGSSNDDLAHVDVSGWHGLQLLHLSS